MYIKTSNMKKHNLIYLFILPLFFIGCSNFDKFDHFGIGNTFEQSFDVKVPDGSVTTFEGNASFAATDDEIIQENIDNISEFEVSRLSLKITRVAPTSILAAGSISITTVDPISSAIIPVGDPININMDLSSDEEIELLMNLPTLEAVKTAYLGNQEINVTASGSVSETPIDVEFTIYMSIEATIQN